MSESKSTILSGSAAIKEYVGRGWGRIAKWIKDEGFPARCIDGRWESDTELIQAWRRKRIEEGKK